jgi:hypothetical protein
MNEESAIYSLVAAVGGIAAATEISHNGTVGEWATLALIMFATGIAALARSWLHRPRLPKAWVRR